MLMRRSLTIISLQQTHAGAAAKVCPQFAVTCCIAVELASLPRSNSQTQIFHLPEQPSAEVIRICAPSEKICSDSLFASPLAIEIRNQISSSDRFRESPTCGLSPLYCQFPAAPLQGVNVRRYLY